MPIYYTDGVTGSRETLRSTAEIQDQMFQTSVEIWDVARQITDDPLRYRASQHLGHTCFAVVREAHPHRDNPSIATLRDVLGIALGPGASVYIEKHPTWRGTPKNWQADTFANNKGDCSQWVREPIGTVSELLLSDNPADNTTDRLLLYAHLGMSAAYTGMRSALREIVDVAQNPDGVGSAGDGILFTGQEAVGMTGELMRVGHTFSHPALQAWWHAERRTALAEQGILPAEVTLP